MKNKNVVLSVSIQLPEHVFNSLALWNKLRDIPESMSSWILLQHKHVMQSSFLQAFISI